MPFYIATPLITAGIVLGATTGIAEASAPILAPKMMTSLIAFVAGTEGVKHSMRTIRAIKKREKEIILEKTNELKENTSLNDNEIKIISKRVAQQELANTPLTHELV